MGYGAAWVLEKFNVTYVIPAPLSFSFLLGANGVVYGVLRFYAGRAYYPILLAGVGLLVLVAALRPYPHQIDELAPHYGNKVKLADYETLRKSEAANARQLDNEAVLQAWRKGVVKYRGKAPSHRPPLVIVTTAGGASVSAVYTYNLLAALEAEIPGFSRHVRIITGASGGMFGASAYRAGLRPDAQENDLAMWRSGLEQDFFSPAVQAFAFKDIPMGMGCYRGYSNDRGRRLERSWEKELPKNWTVDFAHMREEERNGELPSLIFSPMLVEDGRPLLISTLNLWKMTVGNPYVDPTLAKENDNPNALEFLADPTPAVEFFKLFPDDSGWSLRLGTAARMSASFPYLSPAATLPTVPPRRIVDAGYLDNYGMAIGLGWLNEYSDEVDDVTDRVIILEIRPYGNTYDSRSILTKDEYREGGKAHTFVWPLTEWTTPLEGGETARRAGMVGRNNLNRDLFVDKQDEANSLSTKAERLMRLLRGKDVSKLPFTIVPIRLKGNLDASLNWTLPKKELAEVHAAVDEVFLKDKKLVGEPGGDTDGMEKEAFLRWQHNRDQLDRMKLEFKEYLPKKSP